MDHILYDNVTSSLGGTDWGIKVATGCLHNCDDIKRLFYKYAILVLGKQGSPFSKLGSAIGGIYYPERKGYLLCVNVAIKDSFDRDSLAIVGFWFDQIAKLQSSIVNGDDYFAMAKKVLDEPRQPINLFGKQFLGKQRKFEQNPETVPSGRNWPFLIEYSLDDTSREYALRLIYFSSQKRPFSVLGATCWFNPKDWEQYNFNIVFFYPVNPEALSVFDKYIKSNNIEYPPEPDETKKQNIYLILSLLIFVIFFAIFQIQQEKLPTNGAERKPGYIIPPKNNLVSQVPPIANQPKKEVVSNYLIRVKEILNLVNEYEKNNIIYSNRVFKFVNKIDVMSEYKNKRDKLLGELDISIWNKKLLSDDIMYYFGKSEHEIDESKKEVEVKKHIILKIKEPFCVELKEAFAAEFKDKNSKLTIWCETMEELIKISKGK